ncbi:hypothetical protein ACOTC8_10095 [Achromobacter xylosoxidans]|uniref:hypothetical protein n=3 Tax=Alcaligenes xylosoxydans xylosoxydans TaxID=85698 RepID=UPI0006AC0C54|nr:hypothetical protein [Achromobacter xylosoxidans]AXA78105.1 hypothetical protein CE206_17395 [Achromobacter xylosoxidans]KOQ19227.1 hypothetical protein ABW34_26370 [Achromobacter xylosoxidans]KOQ20559.1 hypothetical protein ABW35_23610 [Achromobacter xylosoxidans]KOQ22552.1 hypothetical protein ABW36_25360 [Achromobacter xylosoxidans]KOQ39665.1 hypothetical protein ABW37_20765 [Achromobacter xylosoxidans]
MPEVNWNVFLSLPGAATENFEKLCRALVRRHYGRFGRFKQRANQPGVEFHLELTESCELGAPPRWVGWQCKWYELENGEGLGASRRKTIIGGLEKTQKHVKGVTDWKLWTRHTLTADDQQWFFALEQDRFPEYKLDLLTAADIEELLVGPAALLRETYFGELVLTPEKIAEQYRLAAAPFKRRYQPDVHVPVGAETKVFKRLGRLSAWESLKTLSRTLRKTCAEIFSLTEQVKTEIKVEIEELLARATGLANLLDELHAALEQGDFDAVRQSLASNPPQAVRFERLLSKLRGTRFEGAPLAANLVADIHAVSYALLGLERSISVRVVAVLAAAGEGKSELAVKVTQADGDYPGGVLLLGKNLHTGQTLDDLVSAFKISGRPAESFDRLVEAVDAAGQRAGKRIPIVIDGLNEAEDPRNWADELARADELLKEFPYVLLVVTLRNEFAPMCLPDDFPRLEHNGFQEDPQAAIDKYFSYYKIDATDADLPIELLQHPLTLRIFCEVANAHRRHIVGVEALPTSLASLFEEHFKKVGARIAELSSTTHRIYQQEVQEALLTLARLLWEGNARSVEFRTARTAMGDVGSWNASVVRALESEGVLIRTTFGEGSQGIAFSYDLMAGHMMACHLLSQPSLAQWLQSDEGNAQLRFNQTGSHTFAYDVFQALVGLYPHRPGRRQLWQDLSDKTLVMNALLLTVQSDPGQIGRETVERFARAIQESTRFAQLAFKRLRSTRAARAHPFDMDFLHGVLLAMSNTQRDLLWTEWIRKNSEEAESDFRSLSARWRSGALDEREIRRARWVMWTLTSTSRGLRDLATKTLYDFAVRRTAEFFDLVLEAVAISDPYVPERMFAAAYGAALATWSDVNAVEMRETLPRVAREIYQAMFAPGAPHPTWHALYRQYCLGIIAIAQMIDSTCLSKDEKAHLLPPFNHLPTPFLNMPHFDAGVIERARHGAIRMDFGNYTVGKLIPGRSNYDEDNPEYQQVLSAIVSRMLVLGYDPQQFEIVDRQMNSGSRMGSDKHKVDRYGKKYGWIAYFEMWGSRHALGLLEKRRGARPSDADIDPTFPLEAQVVELTLPDLFSGQPTEIGDWIVRGPQPDYRSILEVAEVDGLSGPWVVLDGFLEQTAADDRQVFTFLRGVLVENGETDRLCALFSGLEYPGNQAIPDAPGQYYTYAGEMPFSSIPGLPATGEHEDDGYEEKVSTDHWSDSGVPVDIPVQNYNWESYHSVVNQNGSAVLPSKQICEALNLRYRARTWDLYDASGVASLYREVGEDDSQISGWFSYLRRDLLDNYLAQSGKTLVWLMWGERGIHYRSSIAESRHLHDYYVDHQDIHKRFHVYRTASNIQS